MPKQSYGNIYSGRWGKLQNFSSTNTPGYRKAKLSGKRLPCNGHTYQYIEVEDFAQWTYNGWKHQADTGRQLAWNWIDTIVLNSDPNVVGGLTAARVKQDVLNALASKSRKIDIDIGVNFGELPETVSMIKSVAGKLGLAALAARRGDPQAVVRHLFGTHAGKRWRDVPKDASAAWLGYSYGIRPLVSEVYNAVEVFEKGLSRPNRQTVSATRPFAVNFRDNSEEYYQGKLKIRLVNEITVRGQCQGHIRYEVSDPSWVNLGSLGLLNPLNIAWELVPLSFVVDWFVPVGSFINSLAPPAGLSFMDGFLYEKYSGSAVRSTLIPELPGITPAPGWRTEAKTSTLFSKWRTPLSSFPSYTLTMDSATFSLNKEQCASALALLVQRVLK